VRSISARLLPSQSSDASPEAFRNGRIASEIVGPAAAGGVVSALFFAPSDDWKPWAAAGLAGTLVILGSLMVSTFRYRSFKKINLRQRWSYRIMLPVAAVLLVAAYHPPAFFLAVAAAYTISGPVGWLMGRISRKPAAAG